ncbi:hypothetical protein BT96DRAFT_1010726 [Gymnopus androsaceus JB14]|uniref:Ribonuclease H1 N-terminal domain-containing protein n=1 Tax=Gymnopus androsaceus JB14 TaxID=1447944 RepID=A0A6A4GAA0_9AGAR|nr:hypothetical protein BT96DRAFT_1010726 [Gymnopus androsaceus JB14]
MHELQPHARITTRIHHLASVLMRMKTSNAEAEAAVVLVVGKRDLSVAGISPHSARYGFFPVARSSGIKIAHMIIATRISALYNLLIIMANHPSYARFQYNDGATEIEVCTEDIVTTTVVRTRRPAPSATAPGSEPSALQTRHASTQTDPELPSSSPAPLSEIDSYPWNILAPWLMFKPSLQNPGESFYVIYAGARVGIFGGEWRDEVRPYVEGIPGVHYEPFTTYEAALEAYTDAYNREENAPQLKIVQHPNLDEGRRIYQAKLARRILKNN